MSPSASCTTNAWFPSMLTLDAPYPVFWNYVLWLCPHNWQDPMASYCRVSVAVIPCITGFGKTSRRLAIERPAPVR
jgi:hypothetical protein